VAGILKPGLNVGILKPEQDGINAQALELGAQELFLLLGIPGDAMRGIEGLNLGLPVLSVSSCCFLILPVWKRGSVPQSPGRR
jgi:hypothetical protein